MCAESGEQSALRTVICREVYGSTAKGQPSTEGKEREGAAVPQRNEVPDTGRETREINYRWLWLRAGNKTL